MTNLFSTKSIVLACSFSFIIMFYFIGGFDDITNIEMPSLTLSEIANLFEYNEPITKKVLPTGDDLASKCERAKQWNLEWYNNNCH